MLPNTRYNLLRPKDAAIRQRRIAQVQGIKSRAAVLHKRRRLESHAENAQNPPFFKPSELEDLVSNEIPDQSTDKVGEKLEHHDSLFPKVDNLCNFHDSDPALAQVVDDNLSGEFAQSSLEVPRAGLTHNRLSDFVGGDGTNGQSSYDEMPLTSSSEWDNSISASPITQAPGLPISTAEPDMYWNGPLATNTFLDTLDKGNSEPCSVHSSDGHTTVNTDCLRGLGMEPMGDHVVEGPQNGTSENFISSVNETAIGSESPISMSHLGGCEPSTDLRDSTHKPEAMYNFGQLQSEDEGGEHATVEHIQYDEGDSIIEPPTSAQYISADFHNNIPSRGPDEGSEYYPLSVEATQTYAPTSEEDTELRTLSAGDKARRLSRDCSASFRSSYSGISSAVDRLSAYSATHKKYMMYLIKAFSRSSLSTSSKRTWSNPSLSYNDQLLAKTNRSDKVSVSDHIMKPHLSELPGDFITSEVNIFAGHIDCIKGTAHTFCPQFCEGCCLKTKKFLGKRRQSVAHAVMRYKRSEWYHQSEDWARYETRLDRQIR